MATIKTKHSQIARRAVILLIRGYQKGISPFLGPHCRFEPTCSLYAILAVQRFGLIKGCWLTIKRVLKCHPLHKGGKDLVPPRNRGYRENPNDNAT